MNRNGLGDPVWMPAGAVSIWLYQKLACCALAGYLARTLVSNRQSSSVGLHAFVVMSGVAVEITGMVLCACVALNVHRGASSALLLVDMVIQERFLSVTWDLSNLLAIWTAVWLWAIPADGRLREGRCADAGAPEDVTSRLLVLWTLTLFISTTPLAVMLPARLVDPAAVAMVAIRMVARGSMPRVVVSVAWACLCLALLVRVPNISSLFFVVASIPVWGPDVEVLWTRLGRGRSGAAPRSIGTLTARAVVSGLITILFAIASLAPATWPARRVSTRMLEDAGLVRTSVVERF